NGNETATPRQYTRVSNATFVQSRAGSGGNAILMRGGTDYALLNSVVVSPAACLDIDATGGSTMQAATADDVGPPVFNSVVLACPTAFRDDGNVATADIQALFTAGANNNIAFTSSLASVFINGANEAAVTATDPTTFNADSIGGANSSAPNKLTAVTYIGAVQNASDTWYAGWTCNSGYASFGSTSLSCTALPTN
ncbi:MAG: hypothetical protein AB7G25_18610, partial [Sphingomonadaceae bacterium]